MRKLLISLAVIQFFIALPLSYCYEFKISLDFNSSYTYNSSFSANFTYSFPFNERVNLSILIENETLFNKELSGKGSYLIKYNLAKLKCGLYKVYVKVDNQTYCFGNFTILPFPNFLIYYQNKIYFFNESEEINLKLINEGNCKEEVRIIPENVKSEVEMSNFLILENERDVKIYLKKPEESYNLTLIINSSCFNTSIVKKINIALILPVSNISVRNLSIEENESNVIVKGIVSNYGNFDNNVTFEFDYLFSKKKATLSVAKDEEKNFTFVLPKGLKDVKVTYNNGTSLITGKIYAKKGSFYLIAIVAILILLIITFKFKKKF